MPPVSHPVNGQCSTTVSGVPYGTKMGFTFRSQLIHLFDPTTEKSLLAD